MVDARLIPSCTTKWVSAVEADDNFRPDAHFPLASFVWVTTVSTIINNLTSTSSGKGQRPYYHFRLTLCLCVSVRSSLVVFSTFTASLLSP